MKKLTLTTMASLAALLFTACGSIPSEKEVTASNVEISGFLKNYIKVVDGTYKFTNDGDNAYISVKLELIANPTDAYCSDGYKYVSINPISDDGQIISLGSYGFEAKDTEFNKIKDLLTGNVGDTKNISFTWDYFNLDSNSELANKIFNQAASFEIIDETFKTDCNDDTYSSVSSSSSDSDDEGDSSEWDSVLEQYEDYIDQYIKLLKKAKDGDMDAMEEYASLLQSAEGLQTKLSGAKSNLTAKQAAKFNKITSKMMSAASNM